jgi:hypothetical protein
MAALTADVIVDRIRSICVASPFGFSEAPTWNSFDQVPTGAIDGSFRVPPPASQRVNGRFDYVEDRTESVQIWVARKHGMDYGAVRQALLRDVHSLTSAVVRDAHQESGDYAVLDGGRGHAISPEDQTKEYITLRLTLPVYYEAQL